MVSRQVINQQVEDEVYRISPWLLESVITYRDDQTCSCKNILEKILNRARLSINNFTRDRVIAISKVSLYLNRRNKYIYKSIFVKSSYNNHVYIIGKMTYTFSRAKLADFLGQQNSLHTNNTIRI